MHKLTRSLRLLAGVAVLCMSAGSAAVTGIDTSYVALYAGGVDMIDDSAGDSLIVLAQRPVVIGPVPESLVAAVFLPYRLASVLGGEPVEANLSLAAGLFGEIGALDEDGNQAISVKLSNFESPVDGAPPKQQILEATLRAIQLTLQCAQNAQTGDYRFVFVGGDDIQVSVPLEFSVTTGGSTSVVHSCPAISTLDELAR